MQTTNTILFTALFITATIPITGSEKTENAPMLNPMQYPQIEGKGPGMGHDYQKNTPGPGKGKPNYQGDQTEHTEIESSTTTKRIIEGNQLNKPATDTQQEDINVKNKNDKKPNTDQGHLNPNSQTSVPVKRQRGSGVGFPGYRGQGGTGYPQHRQYGSPPLKQTVQPSLPSESKTLGETNKPLSINQGKTSVSTKIATDVNGALLHAAAFGDETSVNTLLKQGANPNARAKDTRARTALILAAAGGHLRIVNSLIASGAKIDEKDRTGHTALNWAAMRSRTEVASLLLKSGADINTKNNVDVSPLLYAIGTHNNELVKILLNQGADIEVISRKNKMTPLLLAIELKDSKTLKLLLDKGVKVSSKNSESVKKILSELEK